MFFIIFLAPDRDRNAPIAPRVLHYPTIPGVAAQAPKPSQNQCFPEVALFAHNTMRVKFVIFSHYCISASNPGTMLERDKIFDN